MSAPPFRDLGPAAQARARAVVDVTETPAERFRPVITQANWYLLKEARGQQVDRDRLAQTAYIIGLDYAAPAPVLTAAPATAPTLVEAIDTIRQRVMTRIHQRSEALKRGPETGGAA